MIGSIHQMSEGFERNLKTIAVESIAATSARAKKGLRPIRWQTRAASIMEANAPTWIIIDESPTYLPSFPASAAPSSPSAMNCFWNTLRTRSSEKKAIPHRPITPEQARSMPTIAFFRQRGSANRAP